VCADACAFWGCKFANRLAAGAPCPVSLRVAPRARKNIITINYWKNLKNLKYTWWCLSDGNEVCSSTTGTFPHLYVRCISMPCLATGHKMGTQKFQICLVVSCLCRSQESGHVKKAVSGSGHPWCSKFATNGTGKFSSCMYTCLAVQKK